MLENEFHVIEKKLTALMFPKKWDNQNS